MNYFIQKAKLQIKPVWLTLTLLDRFIDFSVMEDSDLVNLLPQKDSDLIFQYHPDE